MRDLHVDSPLLSSVLCQRGLATTVERREFQTTPETCSSPGHSILPRQLAVVNLWQQLGQVARDQVPSVQETAIRILWKAGWT